MNFTVILIKYNNLHEIKWIRNIVCKVVAILSRYLCVILDWRKTQITRDVHTGDKIPIPTGTRRNNKAIMTSKLCRFDVTMTLFLRRVSAGYTNLTHCYCSLELRHNEIDGVSNHLRLGCLLNRLFRRRSKKTPKLRVTGLCGGN